MNKKIFFLPLILCLVFSCTPQKNKDKSNLLIVTSFFPIYIFTLNVTDNVPGVEIINLTDQSAGDLHGYQLSPKNMKDLEKADMFIINSYEHERFTNQITQAYPDLNIIEASQGIQAVKDSHLEEESDHEDHDHGTMNTHFWLSPLLAAEEVENITEALVKADPKHAHLYQQNAAEYVLKLKNLNQKMIEMLAPFKGRSVITYHNAFTYLFRELSLNLAGTLQLEPGINPSPKQLFTLQKLLQEEKDIPIFSEPQYPSAPAENLAKETGAKVYSLNPITNGKNEKNAYEDIMEENAQTLYRALKNKNRDDRI